MGEFSAKSSIAAELELQSLIGDAKRETEDIVAEGNLPKTIQHFGELRSYYRVLKEKLTEFEKIVDQLSQETIPTMFMNQNISSVNVLGFGRATVNYRWSASPINKEAAVKWLRDTGQEGMVQETINAATLGAFAKDETKAGRPLPPDIFKVGTSPYTSITK